MLYDWAQRDPQAAGSWLQANASNPVYDRLAASYAGAVSSVDGAAAQEWAATIKDAQAREQTLASLDPKLARAQLVYKQAIDSVSMNFLNLADTREVPPSFTTAWIDGKTEQMGDYTVAASSPAVEVEKPNPHGTGAKWANCVSCHAR